MYVVVAGINILSKRVIKKLQGKHDVVVVEEDEDKCERVYSTTGATVINKNPSTLSALEDAGITQADVLISALKDDNENMVVCSLAKKYGVPKVISRVEDDEYLEAFEIIDTQAISHTDILVSEFLSAVEHPYLLKIANISEGREVLRAIIQRNSDLVETQIGEMIEDKEFPNSFTVTSIVRREETFRAKDNLKIEEEDEIIIIGPSEDKEKLNKYFSTQ